MKIGREELASPYPEPLFRQISLQCFSNLLLKPSGKIMIDSEDLFAQRKTRGGACEVRGWKS